jgi:ribonucleoside-diphosphate reductase alpha chain
MKNKKIIYSSNFVPSERALRVLQDGKILSDGENPSHMIERVVDVLTGIESNFGTNPEEIKILAKEFGSLLDGKYCVMSTPILTNAGRYFEKPLSACTVPSLDLVYDNIGHIKEVITKMHQDGMGTGFSLDDLDDPVVTLKKLNHIAIESSLSGKEDRPVGNMATLSVYHPKILEFINAKTSADKIKEDWKFNISVDCDTEFFKHLNTDSVITLRDGTKIKAKEIFNAISQAANACADPGLVFIERMEEDNPTPGVGHYVSTAPCAEVGLTKGESCQFGYINLMKFLNKSGEINLEKLKHATHILTRILDNALEISINNYSEDTNKEVMLLKRKIGIGICGLADLFVQKGILYDSEEARTLALDLITLINFESKVASHELAKTRGSFGAMTLALENKHLEQPSFIEKKYSNLKTKHVSREDWEKLARDIRSTKFLRNVSTIALPPTGRSALVVDASTGIEPIFSIEDYLITHPMLGKNYHKLLQTAKNITPKAHLLMATFIQKGVDESISKTINLPTETTTKDIEEIYLAAWSLGLKGISIYREGSKNLQPKHLS